ncbi:MAG: TRAP transporter large permease [Burkholderiaceae bacterium]|nr:TRAP transporter large permease [Burkholderiaceae bacterium]
MSDSALILSLGFGVLLVLGVPFAIALLLTTATVLVVADIEPILLAQTLIAGTQSFSLLAIPFFMLAGEIMSAGGLSQRMIRVADVMVRHLPGGMGHVTVVSACIFAAISGSAPATTAAIGAILIPAMVARGYDKAFATALAVSAGVLGPLIPPSIAAVIWGVIAEQSIARLFMAGVGPGILLALGLMVIASVHALRHGIPREKRATWPEVRVALREGVWALAAPVIVLGGIYGGAFTPTEAAIVSCVYSLLVGVFIEKRMTWRQLPEVILRAMRITAVVMFIIAASTGFGWLVAQEQLALRMAGWLSEGITRPWVMLMLVNIFLFLVSAVMDEIAVMVIVGPLLIALGQKFGIDPIHFGSIIVTNVAIGMAAPPIGYCLFVGMAISGLSLGAVSKAIWPMVLVMLAVLMLTTYVPAFSLWLPGLVYR